MSKNKFVWFLLLGFSSLASAYDFYCDCDYHEGGHVHSCAASFYSDRDVSGDICGGTDEFDCYASCQALGSNSNTDISFRCTDHTTTVHSEGPLVLTGTVGAEEGPVLGKVRLAENPEQEIAVSGTLNESSLIRYYVLAAEQPSLTLNIYLHKSGGFCGGELQKASSASQVVFCEEETSRNYNN